MLQVNKAKSMEMQQLKRKFDQEIRLKSEAMGKLEALRQELHLLEGQDQSAVEVWKDKCRKLIDICKSFKDENDKLQSQLTNNSGFYHPSQLKQN